MICREYLTHHGNHFIFIGMSKRLQVILDDKECGTFNGPPNGSR